jgi:hypothetical protein
MADRRAAAKRAARTRKLRSAGKKAARTRRLRAAGKKAAVPDDLDVFLVPQRADAGVAACVEAIRAGLNCGVTGPFLGDWNRLMCQIRVRPDPIDAQITRLTAPPDDVAVGAICEQL